MCRRCARARLGVSDRDLRTDKMSIFGEYALLHGLAPDHPPLTYEQWLNSVHPDDRARVRDRLRECPEQTHAWDQEFRVVWPDGSVHWVLAKGTVYVDADSHLERMTGASLILQHAKLQRPRCVKAKSDSDVCLKKAHLDWHWWEWTTVYLEPTGHFAAGWILHRGTHCVVVRRHHPSRGHREKSRSCRQNVSTGDQQLQVAEAPHKEKW